MRDKIPRLYYDPDSGDKFGHGIMIQKINEIIDVVNRLPGPPTHKIECDPVDFLAPIRLLIEYHNSCIAEDSESKTRYKGKLLKDCSRDELIDCIEHNVWFHMGRPRCSE